jgi:hypothetical protein
VAVNFPASLDAFSNPSGADSQEAADHAGMHADAFDAIVALQSKLGVDGSADEASVDYRLAAVESVVEGVSSDVSDIEGDVSALDGRVTALENAAGGGGGGAAVPPDIAGFKAWVADPTLFAGLNLNPVSGQMFGAALWAPTEITVSSLYLFQTAIGTGVTAAYGAIYDDTGALLKQSVESRTGMDGEGYREFALTSSQVIPAGRFYGVFWITGSVPHQVACMGTGGGYNPAPSGLFASGATYRNFTADGSLTSTAPSTIGTRTSLGIRVPWVAVV